MSAICRLILCLPRLPEKGPTLPQGRTQRFRPIVAFRRSMFAEDGCLRAYGVGEDGVTAFTDYGIECLKQIIADERAAGRAPHSVQSTK